MTRSLPRGGTAAVACGHPLATTGALDIARSGGNAVDMAVAAAAALCVVLPEACGLGGDALFIVRPGHGTPLAFHGAGLSPAAFSGSVPTDGAGTATVPGAVAALHAAQVRFGRLPFAAVLHPARSLASEGFPATEGLIAAIGRQRNRLQRGAKGWPLLDAGLQPGTTIRQPRLAALLDDIAHGGPAAFYAGPMARAIAAAAQADGGWLGEQDLAGHQTITSEPIAARRLGAALLVQPPPSQAALALIALRALDDLAPATPADRVHTAVEAIEYAFSQRDQLADGSAAGRVLDAPAPVDAARAARRGGPTSTSHTTAVATADAAGMVVSMVISVFDEFGCATLVPEGGFLLNDRMQGFSRDPGSPNAARNERLPVHTLSPVIAATAERIYAIATPAADGQVQTITQVLDHMFGVGDSPPDALDRPRWRSCDRMLLLEDGFDREIASELLARDHEISWLPARDHSFGSVATAGYDWPTGTVFASADLRRETTAGVR